MANALRLLAAFGAVLLVSGVTFAQPPIAPPPHLTLDTLVKEYQLLGLPIPPKDAELVRISGEGQTTRIGFRCPSERLGDRATYLIGSCYTWLGYGETAELVKPTPDALEGATPTWSSDLFCLAVQCRLRGWTELAITVNIRGGVAINSTKEIMTERFVWDHRFGGSGRSMSVPGLRSKDFANRSVVEELRLAAREYWYFKCCSRDCDRREVLRYLKVIEPGEKDLIHDLEATVAPRQSKPGSLEALIDELTEHQPEWTDGSHAGCAYARLMELGFDAVPALIEHLSDRRFSRDCYVASYSLDRSDRTHIYRVRVGDLASRLLDDLSGGEIGGRQRANEMADLGKARQWWEKARKVGEEQWLVEHALPKDDPPFRGKGWLMAYVVPGPNTTIYRRLRVKYPERLAEVYQTVLRKRSMLESEALAGEIAASKLPSERKVALLEEGASHKQFDHRYAALQALADIDVNAFRKLLIPTLEHLPNEISGLYFDKQLEPNFAWLVQKTGDRKCWDALSAASRRVPTELRFELIDVVANRSSERAIPRAAEKFVRQERIRYLSLFLSDTSIRSDPTPQGLADSGGNDPTVRTCDFAAEKLAQVMGMAITDKPKRGAVSRLVLRAVVYELAARELTTKK